MDISTQQMTYVCELAKTLNFHDAAINTYTSQPNLSMQLKRVEKQLGKQLFERNNKRVMITEDGKKVVHIFTHILGQLETLKIDENNIYTHPLKVGIFPTLAPYILPHLLASLSATAPDLKIEVTEDKTEIITEKLENGILDCILAAYPISSQQFEHQFLFDDPFMVAMSPDHKLAQENEIHLNQLKNEEVLLLEDGHCLRDQALDICHNKQFNINTDYEFSSLETLKAIISRSKQITFVPQLCTRPSDPLIYLPLKPDSQRRITLFWRPTFSYPSLIEDLINCFDHSAQAYC